MTSFIPTFQENIKARNLFATMMGASGVKNFAALPIAGQIGFVLIFLERNNISVAAYADRYDIYIVDGSKVSEANKKGMITLEFVNEFDHTLYFHYGWMEKSGITGVYSNLITALTEAIKILNDYDF